MKPSSTDKVLAIALFILTIIHTTTDFSIQEGRQHLPPTAPRSALKQPIRKMFEINGQIVQIDMNVGSNAADTNGSSPGNQHIALSTDSNCRIDAWVEGRERQLWNLDQQRGELMIEFKCP